jgi:hypothetical protein
MPVRKKMIHTEFDWRSDLQRIIAMIGSGSQRARRSGDIDAL